MHSMHSHTVLLKLRKNVEEIQPITYGRMERGNHLKCTFHSPMKL